MPSTQQLFDVIGFSVAWYSDGPGAAAPDADLLAANAERARFNIETTRNPRAEFVDRTVVTEEFVTAVGGVIVANGLEDRADLQSFDFSTLIESQERYPQIRTVALFGDFPIFDDPTLAGSDDGTNLQPDAGTDNTPWLAGLRWPYLSTGLTNLFRAATSGGFEGLALTPPDGETLRALLERPLFSVAATWAPAGPATPSSSSCASGSHCRAAEPARILYCGGVWQSSGRLPDQRRQKGA